MNGKKRGQITIFVIVAILIIVAIVILFFIYQGDIPGISSPNVEPDQELTQCINTHIEKITSTLIENNFYSGNVSLYKEVGYKEEIPFKKYPYLCYTPRNYAKCIIQEPVIISHLEKQIDDYLKVKIEECFRDLASELGDRGYVVNLDGKMSYFVEMIPGAVRVDVNRKLVISKSDVSRTFNTYSARVRTPLYNLAISAQEILSQEASFCNCDYVKLMMINPRIEINKFQTGDDNKIYTVKDIESEKFVRFAVRGCVLTTPA